MGNTKLDYRLAGNASRLGCVSSFQSGAFCEARCGFSRQRPGIKALWLLDRTVGEYLLQ